MFRSRNSHLTQRLLPDSNHGGEKKLIAELAQQKKALISEINNLENENKKLELLLNKLKQDFEKINLLNFKHTKESEIRNYYKLLIKIHTNLAKLLQELNDLLVELYLNKDVNPTLSFGKLTSLEDVSKNKAVIPTMTQTGYKLEVWKTEEITRENWLKQIFKEKLNVLIEKVDSQLSQQVLDVVAKRETKQKLEEELEQLNSDQNLISQSRGLR